MSQLTDHSHSNSRAPYPAPTDEGEFTDWMVAALTQLCVAGPRTDDRWPMEADDVFADTFSERTNGQEVPRDAVIENAAGLRQAFDSVRFEVLTVLRDERRYAMHYRMHLTDAAGQATTIESHQFGATDEGGRLSRIDEHVEQIGG